MFEVRILFPWRLKNPSPDEKIKLEIIDEAEGTPGMSRQFTRFRQEAQPIVERVLNSEESNRADRKKLQDLVNEALKGHNFRMVNLNCKREVSVDGSNQPTMKFDFRMVFESTEK